MTTYFKAVRPDGMDFYTGTINYAAALGGEPVTLPKVLNPECCTSTVLHAATVPAETLAGGFWPCRLFEVTGTPVAEGWYKRGFFSLTVVSEINPHQALGPQGKQVATLIDRAGKIAVGEAKKLDAAWRAARGSTRYTVRNAARNAARAAATRNAACNAAWEAARVAAWEASRHTVGDTARYAAEDAALALVVRDLISKEHYDQLTGPWAQVIGPGHPPWDYDNNE